MPEDIVPVLYERMQAAFRENIKNDKKIQTFEKKLGKKTAVISEVFQYATQLGRAAASAFTGTLTRDALPNGRLYWNIVERTLLPLMQEVHRLVLDAAVAVTEVEDEQNGIRLKPIRPAFPEERMHGLMDALVGIFEEDEYG